MKRIFILFAVTLLFAAPAAFGQATRTWVDGTFGGDDANPCSRTFPCRTFAGAFNKTATNGEINVSVPGSYGTVNIARAMTIDGVGQKSGIAIGGSGIIVNAPGGVVVIRNLDLHGFDGVSTRGINIVAAAAVTIENVTIQGVTLEGIRDARLTPGKLYVRNVKINGGTYGVLLTGGAANEAVLDNVSIRNASVAGARASGGNTRLHIIDSTFTGNATGTLVDTAEAFIQRSSYSFNTTGVDASMASTVRLSECVITRNTNGIAISGLMESFGNNRIRANTNGNGAGLSPALDQ